MLGRLCIKSIRSQYDTREIPPAFESSDGFPRSDTARTPVVSAHSSLFHTRIEREFEKKCF